MNDVDYESVLEEALKSIGTTKHEISSSIEEGVKNGYTVEQQIDLFKKVMNI